MAEPPWRPRKPQRKVKRTAFGTRLRAELRDYLAAQAASNGRSLSEEIEDRLETSRLADDAWGGPRVVALLRILAAIAAEHRGWLDDHATFNLVRDSTEGVRGGRTCAGTRRQLSFIASRLGIKTSIRNVILARQSGCERLLEVNALEIRDDRSASPGRFPSCGKMTPGQQTRCESLQAAHAPRWRWFRPARRADRGSQ